MARAMHPDSAGSQFFIMVENSPHLDGRMQPLVKLLEGMDNVYKIANTPTDFRDKPLKNKK